MGIQWREDLATGFDRIDNQHRELIKHFDRLLSACEEGKGIDELIRLFDFLDDYVKNHFRDEESLQILRKYPGYEAHKREHTLFIEKLKKIRAEMTQEGPALHHVLETNRMLLDWLINHISKVDKQLGEFLKD